MKTCPFCGNQPEAHAAIDSVYCASCDFELATADWNRRARLVVTEEIIDRAARMWFHVPAGGPCTVSPRLRRDVELMLVAALDEREGEHA